MNKKKVFGIGVSGLVGSRIVEVLADTHQIDDLSFDTGVDITRPETLDILRHDTEHEYVLHLAAKADVDGCEKDKPLGKSGPAYLINVLGTQNVVDACREGGKKIIYISTDFVFDGETPPPGGYTEEDTPHPLNWYAETKWLGEEVVRESDIPWAIARIAFPYRKEFDLKKDFVRVIRERLENKQEVKAVSDQLITPTYIDDIALALAKLMEIEQTGIFHVVGSQSLSPYDAAMEIAQTFQCDSSLISKISGEEFFAGRAPRPFNLAINNEKIRKLGVTMRTFTEGLHQLLT